MKDKDYKEFIELVKKMREAQNAYPNSFVCDELFDEECDRLWDEQRELESEVDELIKKLEI